MKKNHPKPVKIQHGNIQAFDTYFSISCQHLLVRGRSVIIGTRLINYQDAWRFFGLSKLPSYLLAGQFRRRKMICLEVAFLNPKQKKKKRKKKKIL